NNHSRGALDLARKAARSPNVPTASLPDVDPIDNMEPAEPVSEADAKVTTTLPEEAPVKVVPVSVTDADMEPDPPSHRGRATERELQRKNLETLLNVASNKDFWTLIHGWTDPKNRTVQVSAEELREVFESRLNPPEVLPEDFNLDERERHQRLADILPPRTSDTTPQRSFSRPFTIRDIEEVKLHIRKHNLKSA
ncbi:hypothetical protein B0H11DRAFT_1653620, partial [Mycena galericulata]